MNFFVNLPLSWVYRDQSWLDLLFARSAQAAPGFGFGPELGFDEVSLGLPLAWHRDIAARIRERGLKSSAHLPFFMPPPGSASEAERARSRETLCRAAELAAVYEAAHLIGHPAFNPAAPFPADAAAPEAGEWLERSLPAWLAVLRASQAPLFLENTYEQGPAAILALLGAIRASGAAGETAKPRAAFCFDIGHWFSFAGGSRLGNLEDWLDLITPGLGHLHLHDNDGSGDQHVGLGRGRIPLGDFFASLARRGLACTFTMEPHDLESLAASLSWLEHDPSPRAWLGTARAS